MTTKPRKRGINRRKLQAVAKGCSDDATTDALDRVVARGRVTATAVRRIAGRCADHTTTDALDALVY